MEKQNFESKKTQLNKNYDDSNSKLLLLRQHVNAIQDKEREKAHQVRKDCNKTESDLKDRIEHLEEMLKGKDSAVNKKFFFLIYLNSI